MKHYCEPLPSTVAKTVDKTANAFVISFLGDTANGKSFLANELGGVKSFVFDEEDHFGSTTPNIVCFQSDSILKTEQKANCFMLDFEGEHTCRI